MKKVLVLFSLALIQGCLVSNKEFEELDSDSSFFTSAQSIKCMQMVTPQQPTPINDKGDTIEVYDQSDCYDDLAKKNIRKLNLELKKIEIVIDTKEEIKPQVQSMTDYRLYCFFWLMHKITMSGGKKINFIRQQTL